MSSRALKRGEEAESSVNGSRNEFGEFIRLAKAEAAEKALVSNAFRAAFAILAEVLVGSSRIVRKVGPNERPQERHEFENLEYKNVRGPRNPIF